MFIFGLKYRLACSCSNVSLALNDSCFLIIRHIRTPRKYNEQAYPLGFAYRTGCLLICCRCSINLHSFCPLAVGDRHRLGLRGFDVFVCAVYKLLENVSQTNLA